ncbi:MAG: transglycosylase domain-containing protein [Bacteroidota bacterium]
MTKNRFTPGRIVMFLWAGFLGALLLFTGFIFTVIYNPFNLAGGMPGLDNLANPKSELASEVYSADNVLIGKYFRENRSPVEFEEISPNLIKALYATEDIRFDAHSGIDLKGLGTIGVYLMMGKRRGSSTITQQLAKNLFSTRSEAYTGTLMGVPGLRTAIIKAKEWITAIKLERAYTKKEIITMYLNTVHYGSNAYGIKVASKTFFNTSPSKLNIQQAALLVAVLKGQSYYSPVYRPKRGLERRNIVIDQMEKYDFLTEAQADSVKKYPLQLVYKVENHSDGSATYFRAELRKDLLAFCREQNLDLFSDGLRIYTTVDSRMQRYAEESLSKHMTFIQDRFFEYWKNRNPWCDETGKEIPNFIENAAKRSEIYRSFLEQSNGNADSAMEMMRTPVPMTVFHWRGERDTVLSPIDSIKYYKRYLHAGLMSMDPHTGWIKAWVGGINFKFFKFDHVKQGKRQPGSSFKPFMYTAAMEHGYTPCSEMVDAPVTFYIPGSKTYWSPNNADGVFTGEHMTLRKAMALSINSIAAALAQRVGIRTVAAYAHRMGIESRLDTVPSLVLGSSDVSLFEMVGAYSTFVNQGTWTRPYFITRIEDKHGTVLKRFNPENKQVLNEETAYTMVHMLRGATQERNGTSMGLYNLGKTLYGNEVGGKTGTTSNYSDGWYIGITHNLVTGVWVGGDDRCIHFRSMQYGQGGRMAMPIWSYYMDKVYADTTLAYKKGRFEKPYNYSTELDCAKLKRTGIDDDSAGHNNFVMPNKTDLDE